MSFCLKRFMSFVMTLALLVETFSVPPAMASITKTTSLSPLLTEQAITIPLLEFIRSLDFKIGANVDRQLGGRWRIAQPLYNRISLGSFGQVFVPMLLESGTLSYLSYRLAPSLGFSEWLDFGRLILVVIVSRWLWASIHALGPESIAHFKEGRWQAAWRALRRYETSTYEVRAINRWGVLFWMAGYVAMGFIHHYSTIAKHPLLEHFLTLILFGIIVNWPHALYDSMSTKISRIQKNHRADVLYAYQDALSQYQSQPNWPALPANWVGDLHQPNGLPFIHQLLKLPQKKIGLMFWPVVQSSEDLQDSLREAASLKRTIIFLALLETGWRILENSFPNEDLYEQLDKVRFVTHFLAHNHEIKMQEYYALWLRHKNHDQIKTRLEKLIHWVKRDAPLENVGNYLRKRNPENPYLKWGAVFVSDTHVADMRLINSLVVHLTQIVKAQMQLIGLEHETTQSLLTDLHSVLENLILEAMARQQPHVESLVFVVWDVSPSQFVIRIIDAAVQHLSHIQTPSLESAQIVENPFFTIKTNAIYQKDQEIILDPRPSQGIRLGTQVVIRRIFENRSPHEPRSFTKKRVSLFHRIEKGWREFLLQRPVFPTIRPMAAAA